MPRADGPGSGRALTPADYVSAASFARDCCERLSAAWIPVCRSGDLGAAGAQRAVTVAATPVLVTRDGEGALHALSNVCRHRGMTLLEGEGRSEVIRCPYHLWTYRLDGALAAAPFMGGADLSACDLPRYGVGEWGGWVFVNLGDDPPPLADWLAPLADALEPDRLAGLATGFRMDFDHAWNWKVLVENFGESYHHIGAHAGTLQPLWPGGRTDASASTREWIDLRHPTHPEVGALRVYVVFPLFLLAITDDGAVVWYRLTPLAPERLALEIVGLFPPDAAADPELMSRTKATLLGIHLEDIAVCDRVQAGLRSPDAILGPLSPLEDGIARFREWVVGD